MKTSINTYQNKQKLINIRKKLKKKILSNYKVPLTTKELIPEQKHSAFFKDIYKYIAMGKIPSEITGKAAHTLQRECDNYLIAEGVYFEYEFLLDMIKNWNYFYVFQRNKFPIYYLIIRVLCLLDIMVSQECI